MTPDSRAILRNCSFLQFLPEEEFERVAELFHSVHYDFGDVIVKQGEEADAFYVLTSGRARVVKDDGRGGELVLGSLQPGKEFGETALLRPENRMATVRCSTTVTVERLSRENFLELLDEFPQLRNRIETTARWRTVHSFLYEYSNFGRLPQPALYALLEKFESRTFKRGDLIVRQGDPADAMYIIQSGKVRCFQEEKGGQRNLSFLRDGDFFGELAILTGTDRTASAEAAQDCELLALPVDRVQELIREYPEFEDVIDDRLALYESRREARIPLDFSAELLPAESSVQRMTTA